LFEDSPIYLLPFEEIPSEIKNRFDDCVAMLATVLEQSVVVGALRLDNECFAVGAVYQLHGLRRRPSVE